MGTGSRLDELECKKLYQGLVAFACMSLLATPFGLLIKNHMSHDTTDRKYGSYRTGQRASWLTSLMTHQSNSHFSRGGQRKSDLSRVVQILATANGWDTVAFANFVIPNCH
jgi:hypothetical protein